LLVTHKYTYYKTERNEKIQNSAKSHAINIERNLFLSPKTPHLHHKERCFTDV